MIVNVHQRSFPNATEDELGDLLDTLGQPDDRLWPTASGKFPPMRLDGPLAELPRGGHGLVRYHTTAYQPGRSVRWDFNASLGVVGFHQAEVVANPTGPGSILRHRLEGRPRGSMRLLWPLAVRWLHDACLEELLDQAEASLAGTAPRVRRHGPWVRFLLWAFPSPAKEEAMMRANVAAGTPD